MCRCLAWHLRAYPDGDQPLTIVKLSDRDAERSPDEVAVSVSV
jgi:hypothetical protein